MDTAGTFPGSQRSLDTRTRVGMREAGTAVHQNCWWVCLSFSSSSGLSGGLLLFWVKGSCPFPLSNPVSSVSSKTV